MDRIIFLEHILLEDVELGNIFSKIDLGRILVLRKSEEVLHYVSVFSLIFGGT